MALLAVVLAAFLLRVFGLDWDDGAYLHPDELHVANVITLRISWDWPPDIGNLLDPERSRLNPRANDPATGRPTNFAYGALPLLVTDAVASGLSAASGSDWNAFYGGILNVGRALSALVDTLTVVVVYAIGRSVANRQVGLLAALFYALAPIPIQLSHFFTTDTWLTLFVALTLLAAIMAAERGQKRWFLVAGGCFGLAMASKASVALLALVILCAATLDAFGSRHERQLTLGVVPGRLLAAFVGALVTFVLFEPYAILESRTYLAQLHEQSAIVRGAFDVPFTRQYVGTTPLVYQAEQLLRWGLGPAIACLALAGIVPLAYGAFRAHNRGAVILLCWIVVQGAVVALPETKFLRYTAPLLPALVVGAGAALLWAFSWLRVRWSMRVASAFVTAAAVAGFLWTASFVAVYAGDNPRIEASRWIYENVPNGSVLLSESWDLALPVPIVNGITPQDRQLRVESIDLYRDRRPSDAADDIYLMLQRSNYIVLASNRVSSAVPRLPWRYPVQIRYYDLLTSGQLGFSLAAEFHRYPGVGSLRFPDQSADESFINYDHPRVLVYEKQAQLDRRTYDLLMAPAVGRTYTPTRQPIGDSLMLDEPVGDLPVVADARWSERLTGNTAGALAAWVLLLLLLQVVGAPLAAVVLGRFADLGWGFARLVALLTAGYAVWVAASLHLVRFTAIACAAALVVLGIVAEVVGRKHGRGLAMGRYRSTMLGAEATFWAVFLLFLLFRFVNPDSWHPIWGGEKPMEFAHLNAILRSAHFPPYDPWFADGYINYYYYGLYLVAYAVKLTGIPSEYAFNLAQPTVIALTASGAFSLVSTLARDASRRTMVAGGVIGAFIVVGIGNLHSAIQLVDQFPAVLEPTFFEWTWAASRSITGGITEFPYFTGLYADLHAHVVALPMTLLLISLCYALARDSRLLTVAMSGSRQRPGALGLLAARAALLMVLFGSLFATNAWDVPVYAALLAVSCFMATRNLEWLSLRLAVTLAVTMLIGIGALISFYPFVDHYVTLFGSLDRTRSDTALGEFLTHTGGLLAIIVICFLALAVAARRGMVQPPLRDPFVVLIPVLCLLTLFMVAETLRTEMAVALVAALALVVVVAGWQMASGSVRPSARLVRGMAMPVIAVAVVLLATGRETAALAAVIAFAGGALWLLGDRPAVRFIGALVAAASLIVLGTEFVFLADDLVTDPVWYRMNTVFKFYNQVWILLAVAAAALLARVTRRAPVRFATVPRRADPAGLDAFPSFDRAHNASDRQAEGESDVVQRWQRAAAVVAAVTLIAAFCYPVVATKARLDLRFPGHGAPTTLNALDWMRYGTLSGQGTDGTIAFADDKAAIAWFNQEVTGTPVIAEASIGPYRGNGSRFSIATGLPTIIGWDRHQRQQRYPDQIDERVQSVRRLYDATDVGVKEQIMRRYGVEYVVVGDVERKTTLGGRPYASADGIDAFEEMVGNVLEVAFESGQTTVYRVLPVAPVASSAD